MLNKSTGSFFTPLVKKSQDAIEHNFSKPVEDVKVSNGHVEMPVSTKTDTVVKLMNDDVKFVELEHIVKVYVDSVVLKYSMIASAILVSILINIIIIIILT
jgi:hypothetical protein